MGERNNGLKKLDEPGRIEKLLHELRYNANSFAKELGYTPGTIYHVLNGKNSLSEDLISRIVLKFPQVNYLFLKNGEGSVLLNKYEATTQSNLLATDIQDNKPPSFEDLPRMIKTIESTLISILKQLRDN